MRRFAMSLLVYACLWALLAEARVDSWIVGLPVVVLAAAAAVRLAGGRRWRWSPAGLLRFAGYFAFSSLLAGMDVAWRALQPRLPIRPQLIPYHPRLPAGAARIFFSNVINLLPGTLSADERDEVLWVHVIDDRQPVHKRLAMLEQKVAALFAQRISSDGAVPAGKAGGTSSP